MGFAHGQRTYQLLDEHAALGKRRQRLQPENKAAMRSGFIVLPMLASDILKTWPRTRKPRHMAIAGCGGPMYLDLGFDVWKCFEEVFERCLQGILKKTRTRTSEKMD